jgi:hypothetical protein
MIRPNEPRESNRKNLFVAANLDWGHGPSPVRIRNISSLGALVEGTRFPPVGSPVRLGRGGLSALGELVWVRGARAGLELTSPIEPDAWLPLHSRIRKSDPQSLQAEPDEPAQQDPPRSEHLARDRLVAENLTQLRVILQRVRSECAAITEASEHPRRIMEDLDTMDRLLKWQIAEL